MPAKETIKILNSQFNHLFEFTINSDQTCECYYNNNHMHGLVILKDAEVLVIEWRHLNSPLTIEYIKNNINNVFVRNNASLLPHDWTAKNYKLCNTDLKETSDQELFLHYIHNGIKENRLYNYRTKKQNLPPDFCASVYKAINTDLHYMNEEELIFHYLNTGIQEKRNYKKVYNQNIDNNKYVYKDNSSSITIDTKVKVIAHYFPQYHIIPENENWWGQGFTDWTNVKSAKPMFPGHYQPHVPDDYLGYYNLTDTNTQKKQIELAKQYGIYGFCFYAYWFNGKRLLEKPLDNYLENKELDLPFCICWANENWSRRWDGLDNDILIKQNHSPKDDIEFIKEMSKYLKDSRYIRVDNKPLLMVYRPSIIPDVKETVERWRTWCRNNGIGEIYLVYTQSFTNKDPKEYGFDAASEFPPNNGTIEDNLEEILKVQANKNLNRENVGTSSWNTFLQQSDNYQKQDYTLFRCIMPSWDNSARKKTRGHAMIHTDPANFQAMAENAFVYTIEHNKESERIVFVNSWNEWAEGCHLEPDKKYGYAWLQAIKNAHLFTTKRLSDNLIKQIKNTTSIATRKTDKKIIGPHEIGIVYHSFYPEHLNEAISYVEQCSELEGCWFIITAPENRIRECKNIVANKKFAKFKYLFLESNNKGKDILPFFKTYNILLGLGIKIFCKIHSKKSIHRVDGDVWRKNLIGNLMNPKIINKIIDTLSKNNNIGILIPKIYMYSLLERKFNNPLITKKVIKYSKILGLESIESQVFPGGSMFWARIESVMPMYKILDAANETYYPEENGQLDMTFAHVCERLFCVSAQSIGLRSLAIEDL